jgi:hypothetical protein
MSWTSSRASRSWVSSGDADLDGWEFLRLGRLDRARSAEGEREQQGQPTRAHQRG